jgi:hypothetical protein
MTSAETLETEGNISHVINKRQPSLYLLAFAIPQQLSKCFGAYQPFPSLLVTMERPQ